MISLAEAQRQCRVDTDLTADSDFLTDVIEAATSFCEHEIHGHRQFLACTYDLPLATWWSSAYGNAIGFGGGRYGLGSQYGDGTMRLPRPPCMGVTSISYYDMLDVLNVWPASNYTVRLPWKQPGEIDLAPNCFYPILQPLRHYPVTVRFVAGYAAPATADATADTLTITGRTYNAGDVVEVSNGGGTLPGGLRANTNYFVVNPTNGGATIQLSATSGGAAIDLTDAGQGLQFVGKIPPAVKRAVLLVVGHWYMHREAVGNNVGSEIDMAVKSLLETEFWGSY